jgi:hypothetical protein
MVALAVILVAACVATIAAPAAHAASCALPAAFRIAVEERGITARGGPALMATAPSPSGLVAGDVVRQANGVRVTSCAELEGAAAEALAKGLALLLGVERDGRLLAVAATTPEEDVRVAARGERAPAPPARPERAPGDATAPATTRVPAPLPSPRPRRAAALPEVGQASGDVRRRAAAAATALARVDDAARAEVPLAVYERRLGDAEATIAGLEFGVGGADAAVRDFIEDVLALHRTARGVRRAQLEALAQSGIDRRSPTARALPYFSDSKVPDWVGAYPFLQETLLATPHATRLPLPGEVAGRWDADGALRLLWEHAHTATIELERWAQGT